MKYAAIVLIALLGVGILFWEMAFERVILPSGSVQVPETQVLDVPKGSTFRSVAKKLADQNIISNPRAFLLYLKLKGESQGLKVGEYEIQSGLHLKDLLGILTSGKSKQYAITFPEGSNIFEMADLLEATGRFRAEEFLREVRNPEVVQKLIGQRFPSLEGYLFPETYQYTKFTTLKEMVRSMTDRFLKVYEEVSMGYQGPLKRHEIVTLASVIEKETGAPGERPLISSVFHNRLKKGMRLQSDPTIIYGYWVENGEPLRNIRKSDIQKGTPYNTYRVKALPVGPVANPGAEALKAAMLPAQSDYLYFVSRNDGTHVFTHTYSDHQKAVRDFQLNRKAREGKSWRNLNK
ncbi:MAG TPA: endolytic transglycosylase MltG [Bdellovibrionales bacterium]|nr:hypothetical protein [Pseudobdellovibrionaceae bacterium]HAG91639.1 endolytic transglycosylase MltG [Bdellovibrionales bacterium]|tara:strand:+ start:188 stop:1234 length:1047 start_codon:yes stop_codon:yes gene_type:complete